MSAEAQYQRIYERERKARILAEKLLEEKSRALYDKVLELQSTLEQLNGAQAQLLQLSLDQILIPCAIRSLAARKPSSLLCRASQPSQRAPQLAIPVRLLSIKPPSLAIAM